MFWFTWGNPGAEISCGTCQCSSWAWLALEALLRSDLYLQDREAGVGGLDPWSEPLRTLGETLGGEREGVTLAFNNSG